MKLSKLVCMAVPLLSATTAFSAVSETVKSTPFVQRSVAKGFMLNDLSWSSSEVDDFMSWVKDGKLGEDQSLFYGGKLAMDAQAWNADSGLLDISGNAINSRSQAVLQNARLITAGKIADEVAFAYGYGFVANTTLFGFVTVSPKNSNWYAAVGNMVLPFGYLNGAGVAYTFELGIDAYQVKNDAVLLGYKVDNFQASASVFKPNVNYQNSLSDFILNAEYKYKLDNEVKVTFGGSYLNDIRGLTSSQVGNLWTSGTDSKTGAYSVRSFVEYKNLKLTGELINNTRSSSLTDNDKASLQAVSLSYNGIKAFNHTHRVMVSYNHTKHMSQVPLTLGGFNVARAPIKDQWLASTSTFIYKNTKLSSEVIYSKTYSNRNFLGTTVDLSVYF